MFRLGQFLGIGILELIPNHLQYLQPRNRAKSNIYSPSKQVNWSVCRLRRILEAGTTETTRKYIQLRFLTLEKYGWVKITRHSKRAGFPVLKPQIELSCVGKGWVLRRTKYHVWEYTRGVWSNERAPGVNAETRGEVSFVFAENH
ncbi:hypothetical protein B0H16DRAFT_1467511 [Mycena metata]|uniref:Uncharacterized protein n=1 Tax=Mycena metata TaxID=1033252 RepID=A0AAD7MW49_9AGAR|nr:hypothetical protein B0H16DRAFT_1467511 [Mycena metata]